MIFRRLVAFAKKRPYFHLETPGAGTYMERYWLVRPQNWFGFRFAVRLHRTRRSDTERHLHDHPWANVSVILRGGYDEVMPALREQHPAFDHDVCIVRRRRPGSIVFRRATDRHKLHLLTGDCWSVFIMLGKSRDWGFHTENGWVYWRDYLNDYETDTSSDPAPAVRA